MFFDGVLQSVVRISHRSENFGFRCCPHIIVTSMPTVCLQLVELGGTNYFFRDDNHESKF